MLGRKLADKGFRKVFFFEKKKQKTFANDPCEGGSVRRSELPAARIGIKSLFASFSSEKEESFLFTRALASGRIYRHLTSILP